MPDATMSDEVDMHLVMVLLVNCIIGLCRVCVCVLVQEPEPRYAMHCDDHGMK